MARDSRMAPSAVMCLALASYNHVWEPNMPPQLVAAAAAAVGGGGGGGLVGDGGRGETTISPAQHDRHAHDTTAP